MAKEVIFNKKNVLVVGGAGFIGSHLCDELIKNAKVICLDNFLSGREKNIDHLLSEPDFEFVKYDINEAIDLGELPELQRFKLDFQGIQEIYYLACPMSVNKFQENKMNILLANSYGLKNSLDLAKRYKSKFMLFSSSVIYGHRDEDDSLVKEEDILAVDHLSRRGAYDEGKRFAETMAVTYRQMHKIDTKIIRLFRVYGPRMLMADGQMIPDFINDALDNNDLTIYGNENFSSSFCYISDCIDASLKMMKSDLSGPINIGSDVKVRIRELAEMVIKSIGAKSQIKHEEEKLFMKPLHIPDIGKARNELAWMPVVPLNKGLETTIYELRAAKGLKGVENAL